MANISQTDKKRLEFLKKREAKIRNLLFKKDITLTKIAKECGIGVATVIKVVQGTANSKKVRQWIRENLGIDF